LMVDAYGTSMPINQVGTISVPEPRMITVQVWDKSQVGVVERAIRESDLGLNPITDGQTLRVPIPPLSEERRIELTKVAGKYAEQAKVAVRNVRRDGMERLKHMEKDGELSQDEHHRWAGQLQEMTDSHVSLIDEALAQKEAEILQV
jgi:ribosome recycling factor